MTHQWQKTTERKIRRELSTREVSAAVEVKMRQTEPPSRRREKREIRKAMAKARKEELGG